MTSPKPIPPKHVAIVTAAVKAALGEGAVVREIVEAPPGPSLSARLRGVHSGVQTFWNRWTGRNPNRGMTSNETED